MSHHTRFALRRYVILCLGLLPSGTGAQESVRRSIVETAIQRIALYETRVWAALAELPSDAVADLRTLAVPLPRTTASAYCVSIGTTEADFVTFAEVGGTVFRLGGFGQPDARPFVHALLAVPSPALSTVEIAETLVGLTDIHGCASLRQPGWLARQQPQAIATQVDLEPAVITDSIARFPDGTTLVVLVIRRLRYGYDGAPYFVRHAMLFDSLSQLLAWRKSEIE